MATAKTRLANFNRSFGPHHLSPSIFRFTICDVPWLTVVVALGVAWFFEHSKLTWNRRLSDAKLHLAGYGNRFGDCGYDGGIETEE